MNKKLKISVCGDAHVIDVIRDSLSAINLFEVINPDQFKESDIIYWAGGKGPSIKKYFLFWIKKKPIIINHWIGTDVLVEMKKNQESGIDRIHTFFQDFIYRWKIAIGGLIYLAESPWLVDELSKININATYFPLTTIDEHKLGRADGQRGKDIDFFSYVPYTRFDFYGGDKIVELASRWKNYTFLIICADMNQIPPGFIEKMPKNITILPRVERSTILEFYQRSKFYIRYTRHDGISFSVLEALYYNLEVLWTYDFPYTHKIETFEILSDSIPALVENWQPNDRGHQFVIEHFSIEKWRENFLQIIQSKLS